MRKFYTLFLLITLFASCDVFAAISSPSFEPVHDVLSRYKILKVPEASEYPDMPAVTLLSLQEYKHLGNRHQRTTHKIIKILTSAGKEYTTIKIACFSSCHINARTIKRDGRIINLPSKDLLRSERLTSYSSPFSLAQFPMPAVEAGDLIEYRSVVEYPIPFFMEDFRFAEPLPLIKGVLVLSHPPEDSYSYIRYSKNGPSGVQVTRETYSETQQRFVRTTFVAENVNAAIDEPHAPSWKENAAGVRILMEGRNGRAFKVFQDWWKYGEFIAEQARQETEHSREIMAFVRDTAAQEKTPNAIVAAVYKAADKRIQIVPRTLPLSGFVFNPPQQVFESGAARPHDFALFLADCFNYMSWNSEIVLVNSYRRPDADKNAAFPLDLDLVFLNVKTGSGEFLLDCNQNGLPAGIVSSHAINRFALGIPIKFGNGILSYSPYMSKVPFRPGNRSHIDVVAKLSEKHWDVSFTWDLGGELQAEFCHILRQKGEAELQDYVEEFLRAGVFAMELNHVSYSFQASGIQLSGRATLPSETIGDGLQLFDNDFWRSGFEVRPYLFENRSSRLILPITGEISATYRVHIPDKMRAVIPVPARIDSAPVSYLLQVSSKNSEVTINEILTIRDMMIAPPAFAGFQSFLDEYYKNHLWSVLLDSKMQSAEVNTISTEQ